MYCRQCGERLPEPVKGHRRREFCNDACKQAHYRGGRRSAVCDELAAVAHELGEARSYIGELEGELSRLRSLLDLEHRYHTDTEVRAFPAWLRKRRGSPFIAKLLAYQLLPPRGSRAFYEAHVRKLGVTAGELEEFAHLWKGLLLEQL